MLELGMVRRLAATVALVVVSGCDPSPRNSVTDRTDPNMVANAVANEAHQNTAAAPTAPKRPPVPDLSTIEGRTEAAMIDQLRCTKHPEAAKAINAMVANKLLKKLDEGADGSPIFAPTKPLFLMGFPIVHVSGWQMTYEFDPVPPFYRGPGTLPPIFFQVTVRAGAQEVRSATTGLGFREEERQIPGIRIEEGDLFGWHTKMKGVVTLTCSTDPMDFPDYFDL